MALSVGEKGVLSVETLQNPNSLEYLLVFFYSKVS